VGADYLGLQNAGAEYLGPFLQKVGQITWVGRLPSWWGRIPGHRQKWGGRIPGRGQKWGRIPGRGQKWGRLPGMIFLVFPLFSVQPFSRGASPVARGRRAARVNVGFPLQTKRRVAWACTRQQMGSPSRWRARRNHSDFVTLSGWGGAILGLFSDCFALFSSSAAPKVILHRGRRAGRKTRKIIPGNLPHFWPRPGILPHFWPRPGILPPTFGGAQVFCPTRKVICPPR
jgi:hypothetical protein